MRDITTRLIGGGAALAAMLALAAMGTPRRVAAAAPLQAGTGIAPARATGGGVTLRSAAIELGADEPTFPDGPHADAVNDNCLACHSASMALTQPRLSAGQWQAIVEKMRDTYKAPIPAAAIPDIVAYLTAVSARLPADEKRETTAK